MNYWWIKFEDRASGCVKASSQREAWDIGAALGVVMKVDTLPYAATPYLNDIDSPNFCWQPSICAGRTCCPRSISCVD